MGCLTQDLTKEFILRKIDEYLRGELSFDEDKQFTEHILECEYCRETLLLYKMMLRVGKEYGGEIFSKRENLTETEESVPTLKLMMEDFGKNKTTLISKKLIAIEQIKSLKSALSFPFEVVPLGATRGPETQKRFFVIGETVLLSLEAPREGHIAVFHYDSEGNLRLLFPRKKDDVTFAKSKEEKRIGMKVTEPAGKQWLKAIFFGKEVIKPEKITLEEDTTGLAVIEAFLDAIPNLKKDEWMEAEYEFEVTKE